LESAASPSEKWVKNPYLHEGENPPYDFDLNINLSAGMPVQEISCTSHKVNIDYQDEANAGIRLVQSEKNGGNRDFILKYRLAGNKIEAGLLLYEGEDENFFLTIMQPPERVKEKQIPPREYIFIVDVSGSMHGFPLDISKKLLKDLLLNLKSGDKFNLLLFAAGSRVMAEQSVPANEKNVTQAIHIIDSERGGGGTELLPALKKALSLPKAEGYSRSIIIVTDGYVHVEKEAFDIIRNNMGNSNVFAFGIGSSVNRYLIEGMARVGMGESFIVSNSTEAVPKAARFREYVLSPVLTDIKVSFNGFDTYDVEPISYPDVLAKRPIIIFGKWHGKAQGEITLSGYTGGSKKYVSKLSVARVKSSRDNNGLKYLWARFKIALLSDYRKVSDDAELVSEVTNLGLKYNLLTDFTSFVAIDSKVRNVDGKLTSINQPLPLPQGVSDYAVAGGRGVATMYRKSAGLRSAQLGVVNAVGHVPEAEEVSEDKLQIEISLGSISVDKKSERESVSKVINDHMKSIKECMNKWQQYLIKQKSGGKIEVNIIVNNSGVVEMVSVIKNELGYKDMERCIVDEIKNWQFSPFKDAKTITVTCQFILAS
jgi:Ca-activated chloride channel family protein